MAQRVTATFDNWEDAERASAALADLGIAREYITTLSRRDDDAAADRDDAADDFVEPAREVGDSGAPLTTTDEHEAAKGAGVGAAVGAAAGIAAGLAMMMVPGFGLVTAGGALAWALGGAVGTAAAGAVAGGVYGALKDLGIEGEHARQYEEHIRGGRVLLSAVLPPMPEEQVRVALEEHNADHVTFTEDISTWAPDQAARADYDTRTGYEDAEEVTEARRY
jgi:hypothetical protein